MCEHTPSELGSGSPQPSLSHSSTLAHSLEAASASLKEPDQDDLMPTLKISWKSSKSDTNNGGYSQELLESIFSKYGPLHHVLVSTKRKGKALVSFQHPFDAVSVENARTGQSVLPLH